MRWRARADLRQYKRTRCVHRRGVHFPWCHCLPSFHGQTRVRGTSQRYLLQSQAAHGVHGRGRRPDRRRPGLRRPGRQRCRQKRWSLPPGGTGGVLLGGAHCPGHCGETAIRFRLWRRLLRRHGQLRGRRHQPQSVCFPSLKGHVGRVFKAKGNVAATGRRAWRFY